MNLIDIKVTYDGKILLHKPVEYTTFNIEEKNECFIGLNSDNGYTIPTNFIEGAWLLIVQKNTEILFKLVMKQWVFVNFKLS